MVRQQALLLREPEIRALLDPAGCLQAVETAFSAYARGEAELPTVINLEVTQHRGEVHVKAGYLHNGPYYTVKIASGFLDNPQLGLPSSDGTVLVFDARTGALAALLLDNGYITDLRTGVAGAISAKHLARARAETIAVVGSGAQAAARSGRWHWSGNFVKSEFGGEIGEKPLPASKISRVTGWHRIADWCWLRRSARPLKKRTL
jgi:ornithine cyclodeaminase